MILLAFKDNTNCINNNDILNSYEQNTLHIIRDNKFTLCDRIIMFNHALKNNHIDTLYFFNRFNLNVLKTSVVYLLFLLIIFCIVCISSKILRLVITRIVVGLLYVCVKYE